MFFVASNFINAQLFCYYTFLVTVTVRKIIGFRTDGGRTADGRRTDGGRTDGGTLWIINDLSIIKNKKTVLWPINSAEVTKNANYTI